MSAPLPPMLVGALVSALLWAAGVASLRAMSPAAPAVLRTDLTPVDRRRVIAAAVVGVAVLAATGWVLMAAGAALLVAVWGRLLHDDGAAAERQKVEAIAKWLEDLRDTLRGSSVGVEEALDQVAARPPDALADPMRRYLLHRRQGFRTEEALDDLGEELSHPTSDAAVAALRLVVGGTAGAGRLHTTVQALAASARDEVLARERIDRTRAVYQQSMQRLVVIGGLLVAYLRFAGGDLLQPYGTPVGQVVLALPLAMWTGCVLWLRSLCRYDLSRPTMQRKAS